MFCFSMWPRYTSKSHNSTQMQDATCLRPFSDATWVVCALLHTLLLFTPQPLNFVQSTQMYGFFVQIQWAVHSVSVMTVKLTLHLPTACCSQNTTGSWHVSSQIVVTAGIMPAAVCWHGQTPTMTLSLATIDRCSMHVYTLVPV